MGYILEVLKVGLIVRVLGNFRITATELTTLAMGEGIQGFYPVLKIRTKVRSIFYVCEASTATINCSEWLGRDRMGAELNAFLVLQ